MSKKLPIIKLLILSPMVLFLSGCISSNNSDLDDWMRKEKAMQKGLISPLPPEKKFNPVNFVAKTDPFNQRVTLSVEKVSQNKNAPDMYRRKEPLEKFPLSELTVVGILDKGGSMYALVRAPNQTINSVALGNYMGTNYGKIIEISDTELILEERVMGGSDGWNIINTKVNLVEEADQKRKVR